MDPVAGYAAAHSGTGWHGPFDTKQDALNYYTANASKNPGWKAPTGLAGTVTNVIGSVPGGGAVASITDPLGNLNLGGWFIRVGEILLGLVLVGVGVAKLTGAANLISSAVKAKI
jgi:hypothetical protein